MPARKPHHLKALQGTARPDREKSNPKTRPLLGDPPRNLPAEAKAFWKEYAPVLEKMGVAGEADRASFERLAMLHAVIRGLEKEVLEGGAVVEDARGSVKKSPALSSYLNLIKEYHAWCRSFGLVPKARQQMDITLPEDRMSIREWLAMNDDDDF